MKEFTVHRRADVCTLLFSVRISFYKNIEAEICKTKAEKDTEFCVMKIC